MFLIILTFIERNILIFFYEKIVKLSNYIMICIQVLDVWYDGDSTCIYKKTTNLKSSHPDSKGYLVLIKILLIHIQYVELYNNRK